MNTLKTSKKKYRPVGARLLVEDEAIEDVTPGGIVLPKDQVKREQLGQVRVKVLRIGEGCFKELGSVETQKQEGNTLKIELHSQKWCEVGDTVIIQRYSGAKIPDERCEGGFVPNLLLINSNDVICVIEE